MKQARPRSADLGGLHLATAGSGSGQGWLGYSCELQTRFAELLSDMYNETLNAVNEHDAEFAPTDLPVETRTRLIQSLDSWNFEPHKLPDEEVLSCTMILFEALFRIEGMESLIGVTLNQIYPLIHHLRLIYRWENPYHNFEHALDVLQASYTFLRLAGMVPSVTILLTENETWSTKHAFDSGPLMTCLRPQELFVIYIAAIGHDVAHPGFTNGFMKNAKAPLSVVFDNSPLEQMHISLLLRAMRHHGLGPLLDDTTDSSGQRLRKLLSETVLATDMSVHSAFMQNFSSLSSGNEEAELPRRQLLMCQAIIKAADISNPFRPYDVAKHWAAALMGEWSSQAELEKYMELPPTVPVNADPLGEAKGQLFFINTFAKPLLELVVNAVPELDQLLDQCKSNFGLWQSRQAELETQPPPIANTEVDASVPPRSTTAHRDDYSTAFPLTLPASHPYRNIVNLNHSVSLERLRTGEPETSPKEESSNSDYGEEIPPFSTAPLSSTTTAVSDTFTGTTLETSPGGNEVKGVPSPDSTDSDCSSAYGTCIDSPSRLSFTIFPAPEQSILGATIEDPSRSRIRTTSELSTASRSSYETGIAGAVDPSAPSGINASHRQGHRSRDSTCSTNPSRESYAVHAALRAAAASAGGGLRKKRSMANRISWSPSVLPSSQDLGATKKTGLFATSRPLTVPFSLPTPPQP